MSSKKDSSKRMSLFGPLKGTGILGFGHNDTKQQHGHKKTLSDSNTKRKQTILLPDDRLQSSDVSRASSNTISDLPLPNAPKTNLSLSPDFARSFSPPRMLDPQFQISRPVINGPQPQGEATTEEFNFQSSHITPARSLTRRRPPPREPSPVKDELKHSSNAEVLQEKVTVKDNNDTGEDKELETVNAFEATTQINNFAEGEDPGVTRDINHRTSVNNGVNDISTQLKLNTTTSVSSSSAKSISSTPLNKIISSLENELSEMRDHDASTTSLGQYSSSFSQQSSVYSPLNFNGRRAVSDERRSLDSSVYSSHTENSQQSHTSLLRNEINALLISDDINQQEIQQKTFTGSNNDDDLTDNEESYKKGHTRAAPSDATVKVFDTPIVNVQNEIEEEGVAIPREKGGVTDIHALLNDGTISAPVFVPLHVDSSPRSSYTSGQSGEVFYDMSEVASASQSDHAKDNFDSSPNDDEDFDYNYALDEYLEGNDITLVQGEIASTHSQQDSQAKTKDSLELDDQRILENHSELDRSLSAHSGSHSDSSESVSIDQFSYEPSDRMPDLGSSNTAPVEEKSNLIYAPIARSTRRDSMELADSGTASSLDPEVEEAPAISHEKGLLESPQLLAKNNEEEMYVEEPKKLAVINTDEDLSQTQKLSVVNSDQDFLEPNKVMGTQLHANSSKYNLNFDGNYENSAANSRHSSLSRNKLFEDTSSSDENGSDHSNINFVARSPIRKMYVTNNASPPDFFVQRSEGTHSEPISDDEHHADRSSPLSIGKRDDQEKNDYVSAYDRREASFVAPLVHVNEPTAVGSKTLNRRPPPGISTARKTRGVSNPPPPEIYDTHIQSITPVDPSLKRQASNDYIKEVHEGEGVPSAYVLALRERAGISVSRVPASEWKLPLAIRPHKSNYAKTKPDSKISTVSRRFLSNSDIKHGGSLKPRLLASEIDDTDMVILPKEPAHTPGNQLRKLQTLQDPSEDQLGDLVDFGAESTLQRNTSLTSTSTIQPGTDLHPMRLFIANPDGEDSS
ncbi:BA75_04512T0 [Komagataella pastoris]|uniref:BA75_04512T0 n=1 Tax=Komagataella pastoris TaxID=4922 RepID=A0A1B2JJ10_PICPA|nr:BA75_04512T0 [Komagataella pastoris]